MKEEDRPINKKNDKPLMSQRVFLLCVASFSLLVLMVEDSKSADSAAGYPSKPIEYAVHSSPGGNSDRFSRLVSDIVKQEKILSQPLVVLNKPGAGGGAVMGYVFERRGNPYLIMNVPLGNFIGTTLRENVPYSIKSFTPIVNMAIDGSVLVVKSDSPFKTIDDLIAEAKKRPKELIQGGSSFTSSRTLTGKSIQKLKGVQWNFISFKTEAEALINVLSGNVHFAITSPGVVLDHMRAGRLRGLLVDAPERYSQFRDTPTIKEAGMGEPLVIHHGILGSPNMPDYAVKKLEAAFRKVIDSDRFKKFREDEVLQPGWISTAEYTRLLNEEAHRLKTLLRELNLLKKK